MDGTIEPNLDPLDGYPLLNARQAGERRPVGRCGTRCDQSAGPQPPLPDERHLRGEQQRLTDEVQQREDRRDAGEAAVHRAGPRDEGSQQSRAQGQNEGHDERAQHSRQPAGPEWDRSGYQHRRRGEEEEKHDQSGSQGRGDALELTHVG
jgi:hypothetical protein